MRKINLVTGKAGSGYVVNYLKENEHVLNDDFKKVVVLSNDFNAWKTRIEKAQLPNVVYTHFINGSDVKNFDILLTDETNFLTKQNVIESSGEITLFLQQSNI